MSRNLLILASHSNDADVIDRLLAEQGYRKWTPAERGGLVAVVNGILKPCFSARLDLISWAWTEGDRGFRAKVVAGLGNRMVAAGAADLRSLDMHIDELRRAQASWGKLPEMPPSYVDWLRTFVSGNAILLHQIAEEDESKNIWALVDSGLPLHDWIDGPYYSARAILHATGDRPYLIEATKPWKWEAERDAEVFKLPSTCYLSVLGVEK